ncbi:MAG: iron-containing alcohol dehydrogenase [Planctomycetaceae bacterium]
MKDPVSVEQATSQVANERAGFDYDPRTRVVFGPGVVEQLGDLARELNASAALLVTDAGLAAAGHEQRSVELLQAAGVKVSVFDSVQSNPTTEDVDRCLRIAQDAQIDLIVGLGGGSSMDCAKGANFLLTNGGCIEDYWGVGKAKKAMLPMIAIPTTAGTGSEAQSFALIANAATHMKMACGDKKAACRVAILDPELTLSMPHSVAGATGIDAISHAIETYVTQPRNAISQLFSRQAWMLLSHGFPRVLDCAEDVQARGEMLLGAHLAGAAIENSMLGAAHALANPLSAHFEMTHGLAVGVMLPHVIRFNAGCVADLYADLARDAGLLDNPTVTNPVEALIDFLYQLMEQAGVPSRLSDLGIDSGLIPILADEAAQQWTASFNPRPVDSTCLRELYEAALAVS